MTDEFTVLIGSCARGTHDVTSDLDVVRIGHCRAMSRSEFPQGELIAGPLTFIDYDYATFRKLYEQGSLFIKHMLAEGRLVLGCEDAWNKLQSDFRVQSDFSEEIEENLEIYYWLLDPDGFANAEYPLLSHMFRVLKNISIFSLAQRSLYVFEKRQALGAFMPSLPILDIELLISANRIYERNLNSEELPAATLSSSSLQSLFSRIDYALDTSIKRW